MGNSFKLTNDFVGKVLKIMKISVLAETLASPNKNKNGALVRKVSYDKMRIRA